MVAPQPQELSILVVTWNSARWIDRCLASIPPACGDLEHEIIVYDNASSDDTLALIGQRDDLLISSERNDGFGMAINRAVERSRGRYVFLLNPDCELSLGALKRVHDFMEAHPKAAAAAPLLADDDGASQREFQLRRLPTLWSFAAEIFAVGRFFPRATARHRYREVFDEIGPLDEQFSPAWFEDVDYCARLAAAGKEVWVVPAATARHVGGASLEHLSFASFQELWYRNMWRYAQKWLRAGEAEALRWTIIAGMALRVVAAAAGVAHRDIGPLRAARAYAGVLRKAFHRWRESP
jgi:hypothetical protein